jgi:hypothetical protein
MMTFGEPDSFSISLELSWPSGTGAAFGNIELWVGRQQLADQIGGYDLGLFITGLAFSLSIDPAKYAEVFDTMGAAEILREFDRSIYDLEIDDKNDRQSRFLDLLRVLVPSACDLEGLDNVFLIVLRCPPDTVRIIWRRKHNLEPNEQLLSTRQYQDTVAAAYRWLTKVSKFKSAAFHRLLVPDANDSNSG